MSDCKHHDGRRCTLGLHGGTPSVGTCRLACDRYRPRRLRGLGDLVERIIGVVTLGQGKGLAQWVARMRGKRGCGCSMRREGLNGWLGWRQ
jgi:hypothetical protein